MVGLLLVFSKRNIAITRARKTVKECSINFLLTLIGLPFFDHFVTTFVTQILDKFKKKIWVRFVEDTHVTKSRGGWE